MSACLVADYRRADARLNDVYRSTLKRLAAGRKAALRKSQRAWLIQRDRACPLDTSEGAGTIEMSNHPACVAKQTRRRITWLTPVSLTAWILPSAAKRTQAPSTRSMLPNDQ
ncbi:MAG: lysozyme inhibitor LprI family protein [Sphingomonas taxi]